MNKFPVICIMGPTAVGKTDFAIYLYDYLASFLSHKLSFDIISVDSAMVYKGLDIGTGKPTSDILTRVPHKLVDIRHPYEIYSVADFCADAQRFIDKAHQEHKIPILVGGTMMYFYALQKGLSSLPGSNVELRELLNNKLKTCGLSDLYNDLIKLDPLSASRINANDTQRIMRALEIYYISGQTMSSFLTNSDANLTKKNEYINIILSPSERSFLHDNIKKRFYNMIDRGLITEVEQLFNNPMVTEDLPAIRSCGYRQIWQYLKGDYNKEQMLDKSIIVTRQLAKRQLTWLRQWQNATWYDTQDEGYQLKIINYLLSFDLFKRIV